MKLLSLLTLAWGERIRGKCMLIEPDDDELRLFELFEMLAAKHRSDLLRKLFVEACMALAGNEEADRYDRSWGSQLPPSQPTPEMLTTAFLGRCMPPVPTGYRDDFGFEDAYADHAVPKLLQSAVRVVLGSSVYDEQHAAKWAADLCECAATVGPSFMVTFSDDPEEAFIGAESVRPFIEQWRESFGVRLRRLANR
jgi:hypothetical protein